jgi:hypothetical protein
MSITIFGPYFGVTLYETKQVNVFQMVFYYFILYIYQT